ncbi:MAG: hypothetical protein WDZ49_02960 [Litorilinea sp.]
MTTIRTELQKQAQSVLLQYAIFRWESALILAITLVLTFLLPRPFVWWPRFGWPLLGLIGLAALVFSSLTDAQANARILHQLFQEQFDPRRIRDAELRNKMEAALEYETRIEMLVPQRDDGVIRDRIEDAASQITDWLSNIYQLALRLDAHRSDDLLAREREAVPKEVDRLMAQRRVEGNATVQAQLDSVLESKRKHWQSLRELDARMKQAALQLDQSLTALGTIYSQIQLIDAQSIGSGRAERLQSDIREQVNRLNDLVKSINDVYNFNTKGLN